MSQELGRRLANAAAFLKRRAPPDDPTPYSLRTEEIRALEELIREQTPDEDPRPPTRPAR